ncbi:MAG: type II secretion system protein [Rhodoferax sp.]|uniref:type II secretion system protein n=1 Tax=Rhodoferax sp. TaxID=50421 RepID=UPI0030168423
MKFFRSRQRAAGFTLIEMVVTVAIVGLLSTISFPLIELAARRSHERELRDALRQIRTAIDRYKQAVDEGRILDDAKASGYPPNLNVLIAGVTDAKSPNKEQKIFFLRRIPHDPTAPETASSTEASWGLRSYASSSDSPQPGADVFDVYSLTAGMGLNSVPYRDW